MRHILSIAAVAALATSSFAASNLAGAFKEGKVSGQIRAMYIANNFSKEANNLENPDNSAFALGGRLGFETAPLYGISAGAVLYTAQDLGTMNSNGAKVDFYTFDKADGENTSKPNSYTLLGQAYLQGQFGNTIVKAGRQQLDTPLAGSRDVRIIPNLFEAALVINTDLSNTTLIGGYVARMAGLDSALSDQFGTAPKKSRANFYSMSRSVLSDNVDTTGTIGTHTGIAAIGDNGVYVAAVINNSIKNLTIQAWEYYATDVVNAVYLQADYKLGLSVGTAINIAGQYYNMQGIGKTKELLNATSDTALYGFGKLEYSVYGVKASLETPLGLTPYVAYNKISEQKDGLNGGSFAFGAWGGSPEFAMGEEMWHSSFAGTGTGLGNALNGASIWKVGIDYSLDKAGLGNRAIGVAYTSFDLKDQYNLTTTGVGGQNTDTGVLDIKYTCKGALVKNLDATLLFESVDSKNNLYDKKVAKATLNYNF